MDKLIVIGLVICIALYGMLTVHGNSKKICARHKFAIDFLGRLKKYLDSRGHDMETYSWLIHRSNKMQNQMGSQGRMASFKPPFQNYMIKNYPLVLNVLPELRKALNDDLLPDRLAGEYANLLQEALVRYVGTLEDTLEKQQREMKNPVIWLREGIRGILSFPMLLLSWLGVISTTTALSISSSPWFRLLSGFMAFVGFVGAIVGIALGWKQFIEMITKIIF